MPPEGVAIIVLFAIAGAVAMQWISLHYKTKKIVSPADLAAIESRLARIEQAVDAIAVEAERISEGQRFTTKLLGERTGTRSG